MENNIHLTSFRQFQANIREKGGIWAGEDVYFSQYRDGFGASYQPNFPYHSPEDCAISYSWLKDEWTYLTPEIYDAEYKRIEEASKCGEGGI